ncbi:MAG: hypothetical protein ACRYG2_25440 [Janthinobacterium lividum]
MSSPQQPWSPGQPAPADPPPQDGSPANGYRAPEGYGVPLGYGSPQAPDATQGQGSPQAYAPPGYGAPQTQPGQPGQPYAQQQPQQPQPQPYGGGPTGELVINLRKPFGAMGMISPVVTIDGHPAGSGWGRNSFRVPAGVRQIDVAQSYLWTYGRASKPVDVQPGGTSEIFYSGPMATFGFGGAIGEAPQRRPGTGLFIGLMVFVGVLLLLVVVLAVAFGGS